MKNIILLLMLTVTVISCKNSEEKNNETEEITTENVETAEKAKVYKGDFIDANGALVLMGPNYIYGVKRNIMSESLSKQVAPIKKDAMDMVLVMVRGTVSKNTDKESEWEEMLTITEIMLVGDKPSKVDIKFDQKEKKN